SAAIGVLIFAARQNRSARLTALSSGRKRSRSVAVKRNHLHAPSGLVEIASFFAGISRSLVRLQLRFSDCVKNTDGIPVVFPMRDSSVTEYNHSDVFLLVTTSRLYGFACAFILKNSGIGIDGLMCRDQTKFIE